MKEYCSNGDEGTITPRVEIHSNQLITIVFLLQSAILSFIVLSPVNMAEASVTNKNL